MERFLIVHTFGVGDWLFFSPVIKLIKERFRQSEIEVIVSNPQVKNLLELYPEIKVLFIRNIKRNYVELLKTIAKTWSHRYNALLFTAGMNSKKADYFSSVIRADKKIVLKTIDKKLYSINLFLNYERRLHRVENNLKLLELLEIPTQNNIEMYLPIDSENNIVPNSILMHPGCAPVDKFKRWPSNRYLSLAKINLEMNRYVSVLLGPDETELREKFSVLNCYKKYQLLTDIELNKLIRVILKHQIVLNSDSGIGHLAAALGKYLITIIGPGDPNVCRPYTNKLRLITLPKKLECMPCITSSRGCESRACLTRIGVGRVMSEITSLFEMLN